MSRPDSPDVAAERRQRGTPEELDTLGVHAALTLGALVLRGRKADDATAGSRAMARIFAMSAADRAGLSLVDDMAVDLLEKDADAGSLMGLPWALSAVRAGAGELAVEQWRDVGELVARTGETVRAFLEAKGLADVGSLLDENARPLQTEELDADMRAMLAIDGDVRGLLVFDALLAELLDKLNQPTWAAKVRATPAEARGERWALGVLNGAGETVFRAVWAKLKDERDAPAYQLMHIEHGDERYVQAPKVTSGFAWAWGTTGERVGDDEYSQAPTVARYVSRSFGLTQGRLQQGLLPVEVQPEELAVRVVRDTQALISGMAGKAALLLSVASRHDGGLCRISVDELTRTLKPGARVQLRDKKAVVEAVRELRTVGVVLPNGVDLPLWQIAAPTPDRLGEGGDVLFAWSTLALAQELGATVASMWRGRFVLNLSGAMRIDARHPLELRAYVQTAAAWNEARRGPQSVFKPELTLKGTAEELAVRFNALSPAAVQAKLERGGKSRSVLSDDKARVVQALERLSDEDKLIRLEKKGGVYQLLPPEPLLEAHELMREHGQRTDGRPGK